MHAMWAAEAAPRRGCFSEERTKGRRGRGFEWLPAEQCDTMGRHDGRVVRWKNPVHEKRWRLHSSADIPDRATGFWLPSEPLHIETNERDKKGYYDSLNRHLPYVGTAEEVEVIEAGTLVRVSLARWWKPADADPTFEERCYVSFR